MAFFGLTHLGYQNPIGDKMIVNPRGEPQDWCIDYKVRLPPSFQEQQGNLRYEDKYKVLRQPSSYSVHEHHGSRKRHQEMVKRAQTSRSPNQLYIMPLTDNQQYGWMLSKSSEPWTRVRRFPRKTSEVTKFVNDMSMTDKEFSLF
ncbi:testis-expressed protein 49-like [Girardinichthys multiradiatus]|uniref:testis-expressed protein 49-like n=1 Tax=Girardinichthys multiradiatus TaxID=208333 RepID=UPI001FADCCBC|nr:testis-expressed protein 49-like [Girardinichthys multiradiatus]